MARKSKEFSRKAAATARLPLMRERHMFRLLLQSNPNYFGNALNSALPPRAAVSCNSYYEEICCLGYSPKEGLLVAVIRLHQSAGYGTGTRISSAPEHVRFYLSFDDGKCWDDQGCASVDAHNVAAGKDRQQAVALELPEGAAPPSEKPVRFRAVLSWNAAPPANAPDWKPVFGNVLETTICLSAQPAHKAGSEVGDADREGEEWLRGIGLAAQDGALVAVVHVQGYKPASGYHHVTFWADSDDSGAFETHLGTVDMPLSALGTVSPQGIDYALRLPVDLEVYRQDCAEISRSLRVRAILSGSKSGARSKFKCVPAQKGYADASLTMAPRVDAAAGKIAIVGGLPATALEAGELSVVNMQSAADGLQIQGVPLPRHSYILEISDDGLNWQPLQQAVAVTDAQGVIHRHQPDPETGCFDYLPFEKNVAGVLACWDGVGVGKSQLRLRNFFAGIPLPETDVVIVRFDASGNPIQAKDGNFSHEIASAVSVAGMHLMHDLLSA